MVESQDADSQIEIEGIGEDEEPLASDYPIDKVLVRNEGRTVFEVLRRILDDQYVMDPDFQRDFVWDESKQSKLIESVLMRIPLPVFYLAEDEHGRMVVVDGLQRLSTFRRFIDGGSRLRLNGQPELDGKRFKDLPPRLRNRIEDCNLTMYVIDPGVPERAKLDIFDRVNSGVPLTRQQMRNSLYSGEATRFLRTEADTDLFKRVTGGSLRTDSMRDREFVNRFCAFQLLGLERYRGDMDDFLSETLKLMNRMDDAQRSDLSAQFRNSLENNYRVFERHSFRKRQRGQDNRSVINASLWDVMTTGLSRVDSGVIDAHASTLQEKLYGLMENEDFTYAITYGTNATRRVVERFQIANAMFAEVFGSHA